MTFALAHVSIRTRNLEASTQFYMDVLGLRSGARPAFGFPGAWLYADDEATSLGVVHLIGEGADAYLGRRDTGGAGALDHVAFMATDWPVWQARLAARRVPYVERTVPLLGLRQVFLTDPDGDVPPIMYSGDLLFAGSIGRTDLPGGDTDAMMRSLAEVVLPQPEEMIVLPGHGEQTSIGQELAINPFLSQARDHQLEQPPGRGL